MLNKSRYLDVMTVSASHGSTLTKQDHQALFVEPICLPNMSHLQVDKPTEAGESCLFYPSGHKSVQMKSEIDRAVRRITSEIAIREHMASKTKSRKSSPKKSPKIHSWNIYDEKSYGNFASTSEQGFSASSEVDASHNGSPVSSHNASGGAQDEGSRTGKGSGQLYRGLPMDKQSKLLLKRIRENESKIVATVIPRF